MNMHNNTVSKMQVPYFISNAFKMLGTRSMVMLMVPDS